MPRSSIVIKHSGKTYRFQIDPAYGPVLSNQGNQAYSSSVPDVVMSQAWEKFIEKSEKKAVKKSIDLNL